MFYLFILTLAYVPINFIIPLVFALPNPSKPLSHLAAEFRQISYSTYLVSRTGSVSLRARISTSNTRVIELLSNNFLPLQFEFIYVSRGIGSVIATTARLHRLPVRQRAFFPSVADAFFAAT
jgi:hypothetical protein